MNKNIFFIRSMFSEEFLSNYGKEALETKIIDCLIHGDASPYMLIEQLTKILHDTQSELSDIRLKGVPPITLVFKN